jgi:hypothetical protein
MFRSNLHKEAIRKTKKIINRINPPIVCFAHVQGETNTTCDCVDYCKHAPKQPRFVVSRIPVITQLYKKIFITWSNGN